ncbi:MAG: hypothetical protein RIS70_1152, partial [Planctomycetota bacterium]
MKRRGKRHRPEQIVKKLRDAEMLLLFVDTVPIAE